MNCYNCGEEIIQPAGYICRPCLDEVLARAVEELAEMSGEEQEKKDDETPLTPKEAIIAMLNGEVLVRNNGVEEKWNGEAFVFHYPQDITDDWLVTCHGSKFYPLFRKPKKKTRPMTAFECLAWVNSSESVDWMVSSKVNDNENWCDWDIPQRFMYSNGVAYRRARVLPDKSGIDEATIQGFVIEEEQV